MWNPQTLVFMQICSRQRQTRLFENIAHFFYRSKQKSPGHQAHTNVCHIHRMSFWLSCYKNYKFLWCHNRWEHFYACHSNIRYTEKYSQRMIGPCVCVPDAAQKRNFKINSNAKTLYHKMEFSLYNELVVASCHASLFNDIIIFNTGARKLCRWNYLYGVFSR